MLIKQSKTDGIPSHEQMSLPSSSSEVQAIGGLLGIKSLPLSSKEEKCYLSWADVKNWLVHFCIIKSRGPLNVQFYTKCAILKTLCAVLDGDVCSLHCISI